MVVTNGLILKLAAVIVFAIIAGVVLLAGSDFGSDERTIGFAVGLALGFLGLTVP